MTDDRAAGVLLGLAAGDALGAGYEFGPPLEDDVLVRMKGGGSLGWQPGEWTDDTSMAIPIARALAAGADLAGVTSLDADAPLDGIVAAWREWARDAKDVGIQTRAVFDGMFADTAEEARRMAKIVHDRAGRSGGNGSLMRTAAIGLAFDGDTERIVAAARRVSDLTHWEVDAADACVLWSLAISHAVRTGELDLRAQLRALPSERAMGWSERIDEAERLQPRDFSHNGWVVEALQGAWSAITHGSGVIDVLSRAVRGGRDTDTVAAIAGSLIGAVHGASAFPAQWKRMLHGWPDLRAPDLERLAVGAFDPTAEWARGQSPDYSSFGDTTVLVPHPFDPDVMLGGVGALQVADVDAVVSLCKVGSADTPPDVEHIEQWLVDVPGREANPNLDFVLADSADAVAQLRHEGKRVLLHCVQARTRTPTVAALYAARHLGVPFDEALAAVVDALPYADPSEFMTVAARGLVDVGPALRS